MKKMTILSVLVICIFIISGCSSTLLSTNKTYIPEIIIVNQYDKPMQATIKSIELSPYSTTYKLPPYSTYTIKFPYEFFSSISIQIDGVYFSSYHSEITFLSKYKPIEKILPIADYGWLEIVNDTYSSLYGVSLGQNNRMYSIYNYNDFSFTTEYLYLQHIEQDNHLNTFLDKITAIRVEEETTDYIYCSNFIGEEKYPIGEIVTVSPGEIKSFLISNKH